MAADETTRQDDAPDREDATEPTAADAQPDLGAVEGADQEADEADEAGDAQEAGPRWATTEVMADGDDAEGGEDRNAGEDGNADDDADDGSRPEAPGAVAAPAAPAPAFGLLFQAPDLSDLPPPPRRRRETAPAEQPEEPAQEPAAQSGARDEDDAGAGGASEQGDDGARRRRRRGGKGRRSGRAGDSGTGDDTESPDGDQGADDRRTPPVAEAAEREEAPAQQAGADEGTSGTRRRRRRTRSGESSERRSRDEVTGVQGSTRLEAKRQRRREGREAGRRRTIITEAEFLARRESVERVMVVRGLADRTQIGVLEDGVLVEHYVSRATQTTMVGNVYLGRVQNVLPSMEAAFVDIGKGRNAVLYAGEVNWDAAGLDNEPRRIENALKSGESVLVQVTKDPIGHKGARLTSQVSLPGRYLVYVPGNSMTGISRKLPDTERTRLRKILKEVLPEGAGVIVRTAAEGASEAELRADVERLTGQWERIQSKQGTANAPALLHGEPDMTVRVIRDVFNEDFTRMVVSGDQAWDEVSDYVHGVAPDLADRVERWTGTEDVFTHFRVTEALAKAMDRKVWLPSGGSLVIDRTEAMTVVDVNTGKFVGSGGNLEETVTRNNIEAAEEIVRQLRLRDIGGIIVIDFIDMVLESNRDLVVRRLLECLGRDRTKHQVAEVTSLGLVQMTRKRVGSGLIEVFSEPCAHCHGRGIVVHPEPIERPADDQGGNGGGRGGRGRKGRGSASSGNGGNGAERHVLPAPNPSGPTPAQIAAAAHAAALQAASQGEEDAGRTGDDVSQETATVARAAADAAVQAVTGAEAGAGAGSAPAPERAPEVAPAPEETPEAAPAPEQTPGAAPVPDRAPETGPPAAAQPASPTDGTVPPAAVAAPDTATPQPVRDAEPATTTRPRRRRGRVVAPAGPPSGTEVTVVAGVGEEG